jgi:hypothetical protein
MPTKTVLETLEAARKLITDPAKWTQKTSARNIANRKVAANGPMAVKWCSYGAIDACCPDQLLAARTVATLGRAMNAFLIGEWNDSHTHAEVLAAFDEAIAKQKEAQHGS